MKLDILAIAAHPDDVELTCSGTLIRHVHQGKKAGIIDLTEGELGTRGTPEIRLKEAREAAKRMGLEVRENLGMADGFFKNDDEHQLSIIKKIRQYQPDVVLTNAVEDRHPDHGRASKLVSDACFLAGLRRIETQSNGKVQEAWRPRAVYYFLQDRYLKPDFVVDITEHWEQKMQAIAAFESQFYKSSNSNEPETYISHPEFLNFIEARSREVGHVIGVTYGEGFITQRQIGVRDMFDLL